MLSAIAFTFALGLAPAADDVPPAEDEGPAFGEAGSFDLDDESEGAPGVDESMRAALAPDAHSLRKQLYAPQGGCFTLLNGADNMCLGGLVQRSIDRAYSYGCCGAVVCGLGGCVLGILPVYFCSNQVNQTAEQVESPVSFNFLPLYLLGGTAGGIPGCLSGGVLGIGAGLLSAFISPDDPEQQVDDDRTGVGESPRKRRTKRGRKGKRDKDSGDVKEPEGRKKRGDDGVDDDKRDRDPDETRTPRKKRDRNPKRPRTDRPRNKPSDQLGKDKRPKEDATKKRTPRKRKRADDEDDKEDEEDEEDTSSKKSTKRPR